MCSCETVYLVCVQLIHGEGSLRLLTVVMSVFLKALNVKGLDAPKVSY